MALISCPECGHDVSDQAEACPNCGFPIAEESMASCPECRQPVTDWGQPCPNCGYPLGSEEAQPVGERASTSEEPVFATPAPKGETHPVDRFISGTAAPESTPTAVPGPRTVVATRNKSALVRFWVWSLPVIVLGLAVLPQALPIDEYLTFPFVGSLVDVDDLSIQFAVSGLIAWAGLSIYWAPTLVAFGRFALNKGWVLAINLFLGWTVIAWIIAISMAASSPKDEFESIRPVEY